MDTPISASTPQTILLLRPPARTLEPKGPWVMFQQWDHLLFLHWPLRVSDLRPLVDSRLEIDTYDGMAWVTLVAMRMEHLHIRDLPPIPTTGNFPELNFRTYVTYKGNAGVFFLSIDAMSELGTWAASLFFHLPYVYSRMKFSDTGGGFRLESDRAASGPYKAAKFDVTYHPTGNPFRPEPGTLDYFLVERYCSFAPAKNGHLYYGAMKHAPWALQPVDVRVGRDTMFEATGIPAPGALPTSVYAKQMKTLCWLPSRVNED